VSSPDVLLGALSIIHIKRPITTPLNIRVICARSIPLEPHRCSLCHRPSIGRLVSDDPAGSTSCVITSAIRPPVNSTANVRRCWANSIQRTWRSLTRVHRIISSTQSPIRSQSLNASKRVSFVSYNMSIPSSQDVSDMIGEVNLFIQESFDIDITGGKSHLF